MALTYDLTTNIGKVRRDIGDTDLANAKWTDAELQSFIDEGGSAKAGAGLALMAWAAELGRGDEVVDAGSWKGDRRDVCAKMLSIAKQYLTLAGYSGGGRKPSFRTARVDWTPEVAAEREVQEDLYDSL